MKQLLLPLCIIFVFCSVPDLAGAEPAVGQLAPWFDLPTMAGGRINRRSLAGRVTVLVVGRTRSAAPRCKEWTLNLLRRPTRAAIYQVIVADKPWYAPKSAVLSEVRKFVGAEHTDRVLIEYYTAFADSYRIPVDDDPRLLVLDARGIVRLVQRGVLNRERLSLLERTVASLLQ